MLYSVEQVAEKAGITVSLIRRYCREGKIQAQKVGRDWVIAQDALDEFLKTPRKVGYPKGRPRKHEG